jgi:hypothetical protein
VATSATIRRSEPQLDASVLTWPRIAAILDADGALLTAANVTGPPRGGRVLLDDVAEPGALLDYVFGHSCRHVVLSLGDAPVEGCLGTSWEGCRRSWWLDVDG